MLEWVKQGLKGTGLRFFRGQLTLCRHHEWRWKTTKWLMTSHIPLTRTTIKRQFSRSVLLLLLWIGTITFLGGFWFCLSSYIVHSCGNSLQQDLVSFATPAVQWSPTMLRSENAARLADGGARCAPSRVVPERTRIQRKCGVGLKEHGM